MNINKDEVICVNCNLQMVITEEIKDEIYANQSILIYKCKKCSIKIKIKKE